MLVLGIETSCDETAAAVVEDGRRVRSDVVASQVLVHAEFGGVVPEVASRQHTATIVPVLRRALEEAGVGWGDVDGIAVTNGPGLVGALLVGVETGKALGYALGRPVVGVNHLAGHLAAVFLEDLSPGSTLAPGASAAGASAAGASAAGASAAGASAAGASAAGASAAGASAAPVPPYPHLALLVSGGHTALIRVDRSGSYQLIGATRDDAAGEAFDKVGKMLGLGYPGGVQIDRLSVAGNRAAFALPRALAGRDDVDFSFSGLKTAVSTLLSARAMPPVGPELADFAASVQAAIVDVLVRKSRRALLREGLSDLVVCGGVAANRGLRQAMAAAAAEDGFRLYIPPAKRCTDNAAMIAAAGSQALVRGERAPLDLAVDPGLPL